MIERTYRYRGFYIHAVYYGDTKLNIIIAERERYPACAIFGRNIQEIKRDIDAYLKEIKKYKKYSR